MNPPGASHSVSRLLRPLRRLLWAGLLIVLPTLAVAAPGVAATAEAPGCTSADAPTIATMDWMLLETLIALGAAPAGAAQLQGFEKWVGTAVPPDSVMELGLRSQPNLALVSQLQPDRILMSRRFVALGERLSRIAPVTLVDTYLREGPVWPNLLAATRTVATLACRQAAGQRLIQTVTQELERLKQRLRGDTTPLLIMQFVDQQHVRIFGEGSLYDAVINQLGLDNAWNGATNTWGYALVGLDALLRRDLRDARMIIVEPLPTGLETQLARNGLWQHLPAVRRGGVLRISEVWSFGGLPSARRFARLIARALTEPDAHPFQPGRNSAPTPADA